MGKTAAESHRILLEVYDEHALAEQMCRKWFARLKSGDFELDDKERPGQPKKFEDEELQGLLDVVAKQNIHGSKLLLCIWWDQRGVIYYEHLKPNETITGDRYRLQLIHLSRALKEKRSEYSKRHDKVILLHDNARPHVAKLVKTYLGTLKWDVLPYPPYSPDIAPSDYHLFRSMAHGLTDQKFTSYEDCQNGSIYRLHQKTRSFSSASDSARTSPEPTTTAMPQAAEEGLTIENGYSEPECSKRPNGLVEASAEDGPPSAIFLLKYDKVSLRSVYSLNASVTSLGLGVCIGSDYNLLSDGSHIMISGK
ncbi:Mariner Mos1 transposase [Eumeta japonica]|uniref:Mariner Mos1 transposase n=1 Tax=Eumeta variegata TaxID=151549 RepID=A0A4C1XN28_EUMVA|nr:Mariner Mos1 transposase [Eumeta japonica]